MDRIKKCGFSADEILRATKIMSDIGRKVGPYTQQELLARRKVRKFNKIWNLLSFK